MNSRSPSYAAVMVEYLTLVMLILAAIVAVGLSVQALGVSTRDDVLVKATAALDADLLPKGVYPTGEQRTTIRIDVPDRREQRLAFVIDLLPLLLWIAALWLIFRIARSLRYGDPFIVANVRRLRGIAVLLIVGVAAVYFATNALQDELLAPYTRPASAFDAPGLRPPDGDFPGYALLCGFGILALAQVFAYGTHLREDVAATI